MKHRQPRRRRSEEDPDDDSWQDGKGALIGSINQFDPLPRKRTIKPKHPLGFQPPHTRLKEAP